MKKENRKLAQQRRAQERQKQKKIRKLKKFLAWFIPWYHHPASGHCPCGRRRKECRI